MTVLNVAGLLHEQPGAERRYPLRDHYVALGPGVQLAGPLNGSLRLRRTNRSILVDGTVSAPLRRTCSRCTDAFVEDVTARVEEEFLPSVDLSTGAPLEEPPAGETPARINAHHEIDLGPILHDELALTESLRSLCRPDCAGLCPVCGRRLDEGACNCVVAEPDPRLAPLARLLEPPQS